MSLGGDPNLPVATSSIEFGDFADSINNFQRVIIKVNLSKVCSWVQAKQLLEQYFLKNFSVKGSIKSLGVLFSRVGTKFYSGKP